MNFVSCCSCQKEYTSDHPGCGDDCDCDLDEMGVIHGGYWSDYDDSRYAFINKSKPFRIQTWDGRRSYRTLSISEIESKFKITPSRGNVGAYKYMVCNDCMKKWINNKDIFDTREPNPTFPCALCENEKADFYFSKPHTNYKSCLRDFYPICVDEASRISAQNWKCTKLEFESPVENGVILLDNGMNVCSCCYFFYK